MFVSCFTIAVAPYSNKLYLFDSHSRNENGDMFSNGYLCLSAFSNLEDRKYILVLPMQRGREEQTFHVQYVDILVHDQKATFTHFHGRMQKHLG